MVVANMSWAKVGEWIKENAMPGAALVGSLLTGNVPGAVAAGVALVGSATGTDNPEKALQVFQQDPTTVIRLRELAVQEEGSIRQHLQVMYEAELRDKQEAHREQQQTIRNGDTAEDEYVRHTRPMMARQSWYATAGYLIVFEGLKAFDVTQIGANFELAALLIAPAAAYLGFRTVDKAGGFKRLVGIK